MKIAMPTLDRTLYVCTRFMIFMPACLVSSGSRKLKAEITADKTLHLITIPDYASSNTHLSIVLLLSVKDNMFTMKEDMFH